MARTLITDPTMARRCLERGRLCLECLCRARDSRTFGLCRSCYRHARIREQYRRRKLCPRRRTYAPITPTEHMPGTEGKMEVLAKRVEKGLDLWHPGDAGMDRPWRFTFLLPGA